jgi:hypothetical protein
MRLARSEAGAGLAMQGGAFTHPFLDKTIMRQSDITSLVHDDSAYMERNESRLARHVRWTTSEPMQTNSYTCRNGARVLGGLGRACDE